MCPKKRKNEIKGQICSLLVNAFENLNSESFDALRNKLLYWPAPKDYESITRIKLEKIKAHELADLLINYYTTEHAGKFAVELLAEINEKQLSKELEEDLKEIENLTCDKEDKTTQTSPRLHTPSTEQEENPRTDWESTDPAVVLKKSEKTPGRHQNAKYSHLVAITQSHKRHKRERQDEESGSPLKKQQTKSIRLQFLYCNEKPFGEQTVTQIRISGCGSDQENPLEGTSQAQISTVHISLKEGDTNVIFTAESKETKIDSVGPSPDFTNEAAEDNPADPTPQSLVSTEHQTLQPANTGLSQSCLTFAPTNLAIISPTPSSSGPLRKDISARPLADCTNQPDAKHIAPRGRPLPDIKLQALKKHDLQIMEEHHNGKPHIYAKLLFRHFVPYGTYLTWTLNTNFDGYGGKNAIPKNLRDAILKRVRKRFQLTKKDRGSIKRTINNLLAKPRTAGWPVPI
ncbi:uncharacterized protein LOC101733001 [Xenopus tropicalis]|uniref:Uncharacterized protein LOC101733001 n=1 Tax=Xenopus tropicalis TaxID=8364 RepID=A0A8J1IWJ1_XENTR|nr:uncharacterized protein LOC101733001 [Xenopus tropicalis]